MFSKSFNAYIDSIRDDYDFIKKFAKRKNGLCGVALQDITDLKYQDLKHTIPDHFNNGEFEKAMHLILKHYDKSITFGKVRKAKNADKLCFLLWIKEQYEKIGKMEETYLYTPPDPKLMQAGIKELDVLEDINIVDNLAGGDILKWEKVRKMPYSEIFNKQLKNTIEGRINKRLVEINKNG